MSDTPKAAGPKKKSKIAGLLVPLVGGLVLIGAGVGGGYYAASSGLVGGEQSHKEDPDKPHRVAKEAGEAPEQVDAGSDGHYETTSFEMKKEFTYNLLHPNRPNPFRHGLRTPT